MEHKNKIILESLYCDIYDYPSQLYKIIKTIVDIHDKVIETSC